MKYSLFLGFILGSLMPMSCGQQALSSSSTHAELIPLTGGSGYTCFVIKNENGAAVGGNCIKD